MCSPRLRSGELRSISLRIEYLHKWFRILMHGRFVYFPPFTYLFNHFFLSILTHGFFLYFGLYFNTVFTSLFCGSQLRWVNFQFSCRPLTYPYYLSWWVLLVCLWILSYFLVLQDAPISSYNFPATVLESTFSPGNPGSFYWRTVLETKIWSWAMLIATRVSLLLGSLSQ